MTYSSSLLQKQLYTIEVNIDGEEIMPAMSQHIDCATSEGLIHEFSR